MTKVELIAAVAEAAELTKKDAEKAVNATVEVITKALADGDKVSLVGFGTFETHKRAARTGINPRTKETIQIAATTAPGRTRCPSNLSGPDPQRLCRRAAGQGRFLFAGRPAGKERALCVSTNT